MSDFLPRRPNSKKGDTKRKEEMKKERQALCDSEQDSMGKLSPDLVISSPLVPGSLVPAPPIPDALAPDSEMMYKLVKTPMPFGKYKGWMLIDLPEPYVVWFHSKGFPSGELGNLLSMLYEIKLNGLEYLFKPLRK